MEKGLTKNDTLALKGIAILMMLFHHLFCDTERFQSFEISFAPFSQRGVVYVAFLFKICVSIFAFLSGYGLLKSVEKIKLERKNVTKWSLTRIIKTLSGFWFIYIVAFIVTMIINQLPAATYFNGKNANGVLYIIIDFLGLAKLLGTPMLTPTWWYMSAATIFILIVPIIYLLSKKVGYLPITALIIALPRILNIGYTGGTSIYTFILPVIFGMIFADYKLFEKISDRAPKKPAAAYALHFGVFCGILALNNAIPVMFNQAKLWEITYGVVPVLFICLFRYCAIRIPYLGSALRFLGKHSMTIFLSHTFLRYNYLNKPIYSCKHFMLIFLVLLALSLLLALGLDKLKELCKFDRIPAKLIEKINKI